MGNWRFANFYFFYYCTVGIIVPYWSLYLQHLEFSATEIGELTGILVVTKVFAPYMWAWIADRMNVNSGQSLSILKWATGAALASYSLLYLQSASGVGSLSTSFWFVAFVLFSFSVFWNACMPQVEAATLNYLGGERHRYGNIRLWGSVGFIFMVLGLGYAMDSLGPGIILPVGALCFFMVFVASFLFNGIGVRQRIQISSVPLKQLLTGQVMLILVFSTLMQASHAPFYTFFSIYLESYDYTKSHIGWLWTIGVVLEIGVFLLSYRLFQKYSLASLLSLTFVSAAIRWAILGLFPETVVLVWFAQTLHAISYGLNHAVMMLLIDHFFQGRYQVRGQALYLSVSFGLGGALGSVLSGYIWSTAGSNMLFLSASGLMVLVSIASLILIKGALIKVRGPNSAS
jgi:PPP family 3-phenylpropionic acid transporter